MIRYRPACLALVLALASAPGAGVAQIRTVPTGPLVPPGLGQSHVRLMPGVHHVFGTIANLHGARFALRSRENRLLDVDASLAVAKGTYSAPLFVGKTVLVTGQLDARGTFHATSVVRMTRLDPTTARDD